MDNWDLPSGNLGMVLFFVMPRDSAVPSERKCLGYIIYYDLEGEVPSQTVFGSIGNHITPQLWCFFDDDRIIHHWMYGTLWICGQSYMNQIM